MNMQSLMKRIEHEQLKQYRQSKMIYKTTKKMINKDKNKTCALCGKEYESLYYYTDESNISITSNANGYCKECYNKIHNS